MTVSSREQALNLWRQAQRMPATGPEAEASLVGFFQAFRPDGAGLEGVLNDVAGGAEILSRLQRIYEATAPGWDRRDAYFVVRRPQPFDPARLEEVAWEHLSRMRDISLVIGNADLTSFLRSCTRIHVVPGRDSGVASESDVLLHEAVADFMSSLSPIESKALLLKEALYAIACDYLIQHHVLWPVYRRSASIEEPFRSYFELWSHGARCRLSGDGILRIETLARRG